MRRHLRNHAAVLIILSIMFAPFLHRTGTVVAAQTSQSPQYTSPTFGYMVAWDEALWTQSNASSQSGFDSLTLRDGVSTVAIQSAEGYGGNASICLSSVAVAFLTSENVSDIQFLGNADNTDGTATLASTVYQVEYTYGDGTSDQVVWSMACRTLVGDSSVLILNWMAPSEDYETERSKIDNLYQGIDAAVDIQVTIIDADGDPIPGLCVHDRANKGQEACDGADDELDGRIRFDGLPAGDIALELDETPEGYDPFDPIFGKYVPGEDVAITYQFVTGPEHPFTLPTSWTACKSSSELPWIAELIDEEGNPLLDFYRVGVNLNADDAELVQAAPDGQRNVTFELVIENISTQAMTIEPDQFLYYDGDYVLTPARNDAAELLIEGAALGPIELAPGDRIEGTVLFQVPESSPRPNNLLFQLDSSTLAPVISFNWVNEGSHCAE